MKKYYLPLLLICTAVAASAQNIDPTVEVSRTYESSLKHTPKPVPTMAVPDSLFRFDLDFDYSVFDKPYQATGSLKQYQVNMNFANGPQERKSRLYLKAGLGYSLHPELDFVYTPKVRGNSDINIYASHRSYIGKYKYREKDLSYSPTVIYDDVSLTPGYETYMEDKSWTGYDSYTKAGVNGRIPCSGCNFVFDANLENISTKDGRYESTVKSSYSAFEARAGLHSKKGHSKAFYNVDLSLTAASDKVNYYSPNKVNLTAFTADASLGLPRKDYVLAADVHFSRTAYTGLFQSNAGNFYVAPRYYLNRYGFKFNIGVKFSFIFNSDYSWFGLPLKPHKSQLVYPDVHVTRVLVPGKVELVLNATGGDRLSEYQNIKENSHFMTPPIVAPNAIMPNVAPLSGNTVEHYNISAGLRGNMAPYLRYDVLAGYRDVSDNVFYSFLSRNITKIVFRDMTERYLKATAVYDKKPLLIEGSLLYRNVSPDSEGYDYSSGYMLIRPRRLVTSVRAIYFWKTRISGGITATLASKAKCEKAFEQYATGSLPAYIDLGLYGEYKFDAQTTFYARIGNIFNSRIYDNSLIPQSGQYFTTGIIFNL